MTTPTPEQVRELVERLIEWAQNDEMIDQYFTEHGRVCNEAADALTSLSAALAERQEAMKELR